VTGPGSGGSAAPAPGSKPNYDSDVGVTADKIKIGLINLASATRSLGPAVAGSSQKVTDAAVKYINRNGGVAGRKLELVTCDDGGDVTRARACYEKLKTQVFALVPGETFVTDVIHDRLVKDKVPWLSWGWFVSEYQDPWMFPCHANGFREATAMAKWVALNKHPKKVGIMYLNVSEDIKAMEEASRVLKSYGIEVVKTIAQEFDSPDESQHVLAMRAAEPDFILGFSWPTPIAKFFHDASAQKWAPEKGYMFNHFGFDPGYGPIFGDYIKDRVFAIASWYNQSENTPENTIYRDENNRTNGKEYIGFKFKYAIGHHLSQSAWACTRVLAKAAEKLGADLTREGFKKVLEENTWDTGLGINLSWPAGDHNKEPYSFNREYVYQYVTGSDGGFDIKRIMPDAVRLD
jgi:ABC-type branched-subunit amino acid transport system substrate-binding protein